MEEIAAMLCKPLQSQYADVIQETLQSGGGGVDKRKQREALEKEVKYVPALAIMTRRQPWVFIAGLDAPLARSSPLFFPCWHFQRRGATHAALWKERHGL